MAKKLTPEELRQQADELRKRAKDAMKEAKRIEKKEERERIALAKKREREEWLSLMEFGKSETVSVGDTETITVLEMLKRAKRRSDTAKKEAEERAKREAEQQTREQAQNPNEQA